MTNELDQHIIVEESTNMDNFLFTSFSTVFQSHQDDVRVIMKGCLWLERFPTQAGLESGTARSVGQRLTHLVTGAP